MGYQEPSGAVTQEQDSPQEQEALLGLSSEAEASFWAWRDIRGPHRVPQQPLPLPRQGGPRQVSMDMIDKTRWIKTVPVGTTRLKTALPAGTRELDPRERVQRRPADLSQRRPAGLPHERQAGLGEPWTAAACLRESRTAAACLREPRPVAWASGSPRTWLWSHGRRQWFPRERRAWGCRGQWRWYPHRRRA